MFAVNRLVMWIIFLIIFLNSATCEDQHRDQALNIHKDNMLNQRNNLPSPSENFPVINIIKRSIYDSYSENASSSESDDGSFDTDDVGWTNVNEEVDVVIPMVLKHLQDIGIEFLELPELKETISLSPLFFSYEAGLILSNGIVYNIAGIQRYGDAFMTYEGKSFETRFYLNIKKLQFEYNFLLKLMALEGYGKVVGSLDDTVIYAELAVNISNLGLKLKDFRVVSFRNIQVQLDQIRILRELTGVILSPITNLFKNRITTSISDGLKDQMQTLMDDFNEKDPLELRSFVKKLLAGLLGQGAV